MQLNEDIKLKLERLNEWFVKREGSIVAFSGGIDSSLVLYLARKWQGREAVIGVISRSESLKKRDYQLAVSFCREYDIQLEVIATREMEDDRYSSNPVDRCYFCKEHLYTDLGTVKEKYPGFEVLNGTNADDYSDYRPGLKAARRYEVLSPLADCGVSKPQVREMARFYGLSNWDKPASPCLSSRVPYNHRITPQKLMEIEQAEEVLNRFGFSDVRVRHYGDHGKVEVPREDLPRLMEQKEKVIEEIRKVGFAEVVIDEEGLVSGKLNIVVKSVKS